ncbi:putrescine transport system substrate-binding protein [Microbulbifer donghaiensis]|uniref:Putrescine-binding periplasmic protein n=1 Tax=Microbulbifer donghaiensis TaxID=494016 RepID=A0A1M4ZEW1_9GAMM|nr:extracellular solute-binding protein [Microbulbifer donghaiensis]SHF16550.1 putrescine transport system substrate-binding protein [Microbulbifer donghaiensis]
MRTIINTLGVLLLVTGLARVATAQELHIANWSDYVGENTIADFERETGIKVHYFEFDDIEELEQVWINEGRRFDLVVPSSDNLPAYIAAGLLSPLDRSRLPGWSRNDPQFLQRLQGADPGNRYAFPYLWGTVGIGYNVDAVRRAFGGELPEDSWELLFNPENLSKLDHCGVTLLRSPEEIFDVGLKYLGRDPNSMNAAHQFLVGNLLAKVRLYVTDFDSGDYVENLASGKHCMVHGWSGDILRAQQLARSAGEAFDIRYIMPKEGFPLWIDVVAMPANAPNSDAAYKFMEYLMRPEVIAQVTNATQFANANLEARNLVDTQLLANPIVYPQADALGNSWTPAATPANTLALRQKLWTRIIDREKL